MASPRHSKTHAKYCGNAKYCGKQSAESFEDQCAGAGIWPIVVASPKHSDGSTIVGKKAITSNACDLEFVGSNCGSGTSFSRFDSEDDIEAAAFKLCAGIWRVETGDDPFAEASKSSILHCACLVAEDKG
jgi:hypothetical protein